MPVSTSHRRSLIWLLGLLASLILLMCAAAPASAWKLTVHVYGAGNVDETTSANFTNCGSTGATTATNQLQASCTEPPSGGGYCGLCIVRLQPNPAPGFEFDRWEWATSGVSCDNPPPNDAGPHDCQWQWAAGPGAGDYTIRAYFRDTARPETGLSGGPLDGAFVQQRTHTFNLSSTQSPSTFRCELNNAPVACGSTYETASLADGSYTLEVWASDASGNEDDDAATRSWTVDNVAPTTTLAGGPLEGSRVRSRTAAFTITPSETVQTLACTLNGSPRACNEGAFSLTGLADASYTFTVRSTDRAGNQEATAVTRRWTVDNDPPATALTGGPADGSLVNARTAAFGISVDEAGSVACVLDGSARQCSAPQLSLAGLADGNHTLTVRATDTAGNVEAVPVDRTWRVDATPPDTTIAGGPAHGSTVSDREAAFTFAGAGNGGRYQCRVDGAAFAACSAADGHRTGALALGRHTLEVRAIDEAQNVDGSPASRTWTVIAADGDGDGSPLGSDCDDADPAERPGGVEIPGNGKDDDCLDGDAPLLDSDGDGIADPFDLCPAVARGAYDGDADGCVGPYGRIAITSGGTWTITRRGLAVSEFHVDGAPRGAKVEVLCAGKRAKCRYAQTRTAKGGRVRLRKLAGKLLKPGARFVIRVTAAGMIGQQVSRMVNRPGKGGAGLRKFARRPFKTTKRCLAAGSLEPARTCSPTPPSGP